MPNERPPLVSVGLVAGAALAYEVLLTRLFAIIQWHHFAYMAISLALLGFGVSGTFLALAGARLGARYATSFAVNAALFGASSYACFEAAQHVPFNALEVLWEPQQLASLSLIYVLLMIPFFFAANCIALTFLRFGARVGAVYGADLVGSGLGALGVVLLLFALPPWWALHVLAAIGAAAAALAWLTQRARPRWAAALPALLALGLLAPGGEGWQSLEISEYKQLQALLRQPGAHVTETRSSPLGLLQVVQSPDVPLRHVPGLSLAADTEPPPQLGLVTDGQALSVITRFDGRMAPLSYLAQTTSALPYRLTREPEVLVLGAGGGADVLQALYHGARRVDAVEVNPQVVALVRDEYRDFAGALYDHPRVRVHVAEARGFVAASQARYDLIQVALLDSFNASSAGLHALSESHLYTVEAFGEYLAHLEPDGMLALTRWVKLPPRDGVKLFATAAEALRRAGVADPGRHLAWVRGWNTSTLVVKRSPWRAADSQALRRFCAELSFDPVYYPGMRPDEANRFNRLARPYFSEAARALLGPERQDFLERYKFDVTPATDDRPYFHNFFKWRALPEIASLRERGGVALLELGYLILVATLVQAVATSTLLILLPLALRRRRRARASVRRSRVLAFFLAIGLAFLFVEIAFIQKFMLFLSHPVYAVAVVLTGFLVFAGLGARRARGRLPLGAPVAGIVAIGVAYIWLLPPLFAASMGLPAALKIPIALGLIAPLAFCMGMPFPRGLAALSGAGEAWMAWAWGINGCASVVSAVLGTLLAIHQGFTVVVLTALALYVLAWMSGPETFSTNDGA